jgi:hypothetical protein
MDTNHPGNVLSLIMNGNTAQNLAIRCNMEDTKRRVNTVTYYDMIMGKGFYAI